MLLEIAGGNFFYRLDRLGENDSIEGVEMALNMLAEEIQEQLPYKSFVNSKENIKHIVQMSFLLDADGYIQKVNAKTCIFLQAQYEDIVGKPFETFLQKDSKKKWRETLKSLQKKDLFDTALDLDIKTNQQLLIPNSAYITTYRGKQKKEPTIQVTIVLHKKVQSELEKELKKKVLDFSKKKESKRSSVLKKSKKQNLILSYEDINKLKKAHNRIVANPEKNLPTLKKFALELGTNEFKLKYGFKKLYGISVHQFLLNERFRKIILLVQFSDLSLKHIASMTGFKSYPHFSRTFKKRYGYSASSLRKRSQIERKEEISRLVSLRGKK